MNTELIRQFAVPAMGAALAMMLLVSSIGCASEGIARNINHTHWHDDETIVFVYERNPAAGGLNAMFNPAPITAHVMVCKVREDNSIRCKDQPSLNNMLNPHAVDRIDLTDRWTP